ncbi:hypothetical protein GWK47_037805 [Chionoecetes opilio]|uniref:Uncharacterized protein n=1 Tax=Chionoecetes opilio TaxID=41210 RepID=A0A8J5CZ50_CHIOP|nr:hypothetical protein GWK47_037805 [Chionoecetes opilio]
MSLLLIRTVSNATRPFQHPAVKKIDPCSYRQHLDLHFGSQTVSGLQLLAMNKNKDEHRYYHKEKEVAFVNEETDHSRCCFPRRPILPPAPCRTYSTAAATPGEHRENVSDTWLLPLAGAATIAAGALMLMVALARAQGNHSFSHLSSLCRTSSPPVPGRCHRGGASGPTPGGQPSGRSLGFGPLSSV